MTNQVELVVQDRDTGNIFNLNEVVLNGISLTSELNNGPSKLSFKYKIDKQNSVIFPNGSICRFLYKNNKVFYGYVFTTKEDEDSVEVTAYDSLRYLKYKDSKVIKDTNNTLSKLLKEIIQERKLKPGIIDNTSYAIPPKLIDNQTYLDMIYDMVGNTLLYTGKKYILYDKFGAIHLEEAEKLRQPVIIGNESFLQDYNYSRSIDNETYNIVKLARDNKETGTREHFQVQDSANIAKWGMLQYYNKEENLNDAQMKDKAAKLLKLYNREEKKLSITSFSDVRVLGGHGVYVDIHQLKIKNWFMVKKVSHDFYPNYAKMEVELVL